MLSRLVLTGFRNHADAALTPGAGFVVLTGENGAGKTNVLEAVSLLAPGRGLRRAALGEMARQGGSGGFGVAATLVGEAELATGIEPGSANRRLVRINGAPALILSSISFCVCPSTTKRSGESGCVRTSKSGSLTWSRPCSAAMRRQNGAAADISPPARATRYSPT